MYRQLLIAGLVAGASLTAGGIAVWTMEKSPAELHSEVGHKLKPIAQSVRTANWREHGSAALAPVAVAPAAAERHAVPDVAAAPARREFVAVSTAAPAEPALPEATRGASHCALTDNCTHGLVTGTAEQNAGSGPAPLGASGALPFAAAGAPLAQVNTAPAPAAPAAAPAPSLTMLLADTTAVGPTTIVEAVEYGRTGGPRSVLGQAQEVPGSAPAGGPAPAPASGDPAASAPAGPGITFTETPFAPQPLTQPSGTPDPLSAPPVILASGPQIVRQLDPDGAGPTTPLLEQAVSAAADSAVGEPSTNILLLMAMLGAAVMVRRRVP